ncbi:mono/diheme cytochrome c family protein [Sphingobium sp. B1D7B]|uniref:c-type cytochrome n=1 Tax=Sphingobium sp. B1D7B TaxID=2940578 RepID=UPI0022250181|nr:cytochrome c [Sphingobium sp. B1D7B]MCW2406911.1 mono/diheme cytochrome c family protein [Sphingobium sp. B1D7B]
MLVAAGAAFFFSGQPEAVANTGPRPPEAIYDRTCGYCHGHNVGPVIRGRNLPPEAIVYMVRHGQGAMPAFRPTEISDVELANLAKWISTSKANPKEHGK